MENSIRFSKEYVGNFDGTEYTLGPSKTTPVSIQEIFEWIESLGSNYQIPTLEMLQHCKNTPTLAMYFEPEKYWCINRVSTPDSVTTYGLSYDFYSGEHEPNGLTSRALIQLVKAE